MIYIKRFFDILKTDIILAFILAISALLFSVNYYVSIIFAIVFFAICLFYPIEKVLYTYVFLFLFDQVLSFSLLHGSVVRVLQPIIALRLLWLIFKDKPKIKLQDYAVVAFVFISFIIGYFTLGLKFDSVSLVVNITLFIMFKIVLSSYEISKPEMIAQIYRKSMLFLVISVVISTIHGLLYANFITDLSANSVIYRFRGTYEPNFAALFTCVALIAWLCTHENFCKSKFTKILSWVITGILLGSIYITYSITGYGVTFVALAIFFIWNRKETKINVRNICFSVIAAVILVSLFNLFTTIFPKYYIIPENSSVITATEGGTSGAVQESIPMLQRILKLNELYKSGQLNELTSGRLGLIVDSLKDSFGRPVLSVVFGSGPYIQEHFSAYFGYDKFSHNTYADLLNCFGVLGFIVIAVWVFSMSSKKKFLSIALKGKDAMSITIIRIVLLLFACTLSYFTNRIFLFFFII